MKKMPRWVNVLSITIGFVFMNAWMFAWAFAISWGVSESREFLRLIPLGIAGFIVPWGMVQLIARLIVYLKSRLQHTS